MQSGSMTGAAQLMSVSQPAVSRLIKDFESRIGFALFERRKGRVHPTTEAFSLFEEVQRSFTGLDKISAAAAEIASFRSGFLRIAAMPAIALQFLPRVVTAFSAQYPDINVSIQIRSSTKVVDWVGAQQVDLGFAALQSTSPGTEQKALCDGPVVAAVPTGHRLAGKPVLRPEDLKDTPIISLGPELFMRDRIDEVFALRGVPMQSRIEVQLSAAICEFVVAEAGIGLVDPITAFEMSDRNLVIRPFEPAMRFFFSLLMPLNRTRPIFLDLFMQIMFDELRLNPYVNIPAETLHSFEKTER
jgi:DNA-binding transcriptional LysR family regulator